MILFPSAGKTNATAMKDPGFTGEGSAAESMNLQSRPGPSVPQIYTLLTPFHPSPCVLTQPDFPSTPHFTQHRSFRPAAISALVSPLYPVPPVILGPILPALGSLQPTPLLPCCAGHKTCLKSEGTAQTPPLAGNKGGRFLQEV